MSPYICNICHKSFNSNQHLKQHKNKKNPCYNVATKQTEIDPNIAVSLQSTYLSDFIVNYQKLVHERELTNKLIEEFKLQKMELLIENKILKKKIKAISQIIHNSNKDDDTEMEYDYSTCSESNASTTSGYTSDYTCGIPKKMLSPFNTKNVTNLTNLPSPITLFTSESPIDSIMYDNSNNLDENPSSLESNTTDIITKSDK
jgi:hypothetical protein